VSLSTFFIGMLSLGCGKYLGVSLPILFFCFTIVCMQFIEYIVWTYYDNEDINRQASIAASTLLWLQPVASILLIPSLNIKLILLVSYCVLSMIGQAITQKTDYSMKRASNGHLSWNFLEKDSFINLAVYMLFLFIPIFMTGSFELLTIAVGMLDVSFYSYWRSNTWGSMWCWLVNSIVIIIVGSHAFTKGKIIS